MTALYHSTSFGVLIAVLTVDMAWSTSQAQSPQPINGNGKAESTGDVYSRYRNWKPAYKEPKATVAEAMAACAPAVRVRPPLDSHEGGFINIYINQIGRDGYLDKKAPALARGSVIVKEKLKKKDGKGPIELGIMIKREAGFAPDSGDWQFLFVDQKGTVSDGQGLQKSCVACHRMHAKEDFVFRKLSPEVSSGRGNDEGTANGVEHNGNAHVREKSERTIIAPASGGVEIEEITIVRRKAHGAVKEADLTNMCVELQLIGAWEGEADHHLVRLHSLSPIKDDTGQLLTTQKRLKQIDYLQGEVRGQEWGYRAEKKAGPSIRLFLDAPQRSATKIMAIQGRAEVSRARAVELSFADLPAINGKDLSHPDMPKLKDLKLRFSVEVKDEQVVTRVSAPFNYASPWHIGRLQMWKVWDKVAKMPTLASESTDLENGGVTVERTYRHASFDGWSLDIVVLEPVETKTFDFEFRDVELP